MSYAAANMGPVGESASGDVVNNPASGITTPVVTEQSLKLANPIDPYAPIRAQITKPVKLLENVFGPDVRADPTKRNYIVAESLTAKPSARDQMNLGSLPYATSPKLRRLPADRMVPMDTRIPRGEWNEALARSGPFYERHWQIWDNAPFLPSNGDIALDPRYTANRMRQFSSSYKTRGL